MNQIFGGIECKLYICHVIFLHSIRFKVNKGWSKALLLSFLVPSVSFHSPNHQLLNAVEFFKIFCFLFSSNGFYVIFVSM